MDYYSDVCDESFELKSKKKHLRSLTQKELEKSIRTKDTLEKAEVFNIDEIFNDSITNHNKNID